MREPQPLAGSDEGPLVVTERDIEGSWRRAAAGTRVSLRLAAGDTVSRVGGTLTGFEPGDVFEEEEIG